MKIAPSMKMIMNLCKQDRLDAWGSLRIAFTQSPLSKNKIFCVFESDLVHILLADSIISTSKWFQEMKNFRLLKAGEEWCIVFKVSVQGYYGSLRVQLQPMMRDFFRYRLYGYSDFFVVQLSKTGMPVRNQVRGSMNASQFITLSHCFPSNQSTGLPQCSARMTAFRFAHMNCHQID